jgi:hypothetical protein
MYRMQVGYASVLIDGSLSHWNICESRIFKEYSKWKMKQQHNMRTLKSEASYAFRLAL